MDYSRNWFFINDDLQSKIKNYNIFYGGCGLSSRISEDLLRTGFEGLHYLVDFDTVEESNLNRQNFTEQDINHSKAQATFNRLGMINKNVEVIYAQKKIDSSTIQTFIEPIKKSEIVINTIDFSEDDAYHLLNKTALSLGKTVFCPFNLSYASYVQIWKPEDVYMRKPQETIIENVILKYPKAKFLQAYLDDSERYSKPISQLGLGVSLVSWHVGMLILKNIKMPHRLERDNFIEI